MNTTAEQETKYMLEGKIMIPATPDGVAASLALGNKLFDFNHERDLSFQQYNVFAPFNCTRGNFIDIGDNTVININCYILEGGPVKIGNNVMIGPNVSLIGGTHSTDPKIRNACGGTAYGKPITIKDGAWIGCGAIILPGVTIGENAVVGSGSVVTHDVPDNMIAVGNPAKVRRRVSEHLGWTIENRDVPLD
ncbi:maltose O-acetyltransferase, putative [Entamoeba histolytica HM-1:IMSS]|uniref:Maltose O-acetyltransferase, putative n=1 Tax=Entamoeba histolytica (strain ATCC 30459 / HM-1:IMSS / ABRM) TaxID=294381 RepID=B1N5J1_ENTH1|nr:maltose O-acetyltransferase, putative [Entamoeba histolytica HM-1:IMSS]EDS88768.1 maltose O-acetyltransferase, putative [Entamoeba histolytica HM-1:IMSS]|eukprot:XP_001914457.1 maltose O-acetyltransferase, putative [Entamoeba histolytica HM-1:IMSS]